jgi:DNA adenine methylase
MESLQPAGVAPVRPLAGYVGGKRSLARRLAAMIAEIPHDTYAEPFVGMGGVFLRRGERARSEIINDWSLDVATFFRILQRHYVAFLEMLRFQLTTRSEFERLSATDPATLTDLERAARFLYLQRTAFGDKVVGRSFAMTRDGRGARFDITRLGPMLEDLHTRLAGVVIERLPFAEFIARYDSPGTLFYVDPPYFGSEHYYGAGMFGRADHQVLADVLARIRGRFILSINDAPEMREIFAGFDVASAETNYGLQGGGQVARELIITGP